MRKTIEKITLAAVFLALLLSIKAMKMYKDYNSEENRIKRVQESITISLPEEMEYSKEPVKIRQYIDLGQAEQENTELRLYPEEFIPDIPGTHELTYLIKITDKYGHV